MYHSQSRPSPHSICPWVTWLLIHCIDLISKVLFKCSITPRQPWSVSSFCLESGWIANVSSVAVAKHLATEAGLCRLVFGGLKPGRVACFVCLVFFNLLEKHNYTCHQEKLPPLACFSTESCTLQLQIPIDGDCIRSEILMNDHSCFNSRIKVKGKKWFNRASTVSMDNTAFTHWFLGWMIQGFSLFF